jgi:hypothetical protein
LEITKGYKASRNVIHSTYHSVRLKLARIFSAVYEPSQRKENNSAARAGRRIVSCQRYSVWSTLKCTLLACRSLTVPERLTFYCARQFSDRVSLDATWPELLKKGIRGGTTREIVSNLNREGRKAEVLNPSRPIPEINVILYPDFQTPPEYR